MQNSDFARRVWGIYLAPGMALGAVKFVSLMMWFVWYGSWGTLPNINGHKISYVGTIISGVLGVVLSIVAWPFSVFQLLNGSATPGEILFFPWVLPS